jgi:hypothetical protein
MDENPDLSDEAIAEGLNRSVAFVRRHRMLAGAISLGETSASALDRLHRSRFWPQIKKVLLPHEEKYFEYQWCQLIDQFSTSEILATDELMVKDYIILEIEANRFLMEKKDALTEIAALNQLITEERMKEMQFQDLGAIAAWQTQINGLRAALPNLSKAFTEYQAKKDQKLAQLKATRADRFKNVQESKVNIFELIKGLDEIERRKKEGRWMGLEKLAADQVEKQWGEPIEFADGTVDKPFLSPEGELNED